MRHLQLLSLVGIVTAACTSATYASELSTGRPQKNEALFKHNSQFVISLGIQNGGDELIALTDTSSNEQYDSSRAGGYTRLVFGGDIAVPNTPFSVEVSAGVMRDALTSNVNEDKSIFRRKVIELIPFWNFDRHRVGIGAVAHLDPVWRVNLESGSDFGADFKDAVGAVLQYDIRYDQNFSVGARYTWITYDKDRDSHPAGGIAASEYSGNALGLHFTYAF